MSMAEQALVIDGGGAAIRDYPAYQLEKMCFGNGYSVMVVFVDFTTIALDVNGHLYSKSDALIKYSEARFSPVSSHPVDCIQLARPSYYRQFNEGQNSELIADEEEGIYIERLNGWGQQGSWHIENIKKDIYANNPNINLNVEITYDIDDCWLYCASVDPIANYERLWQMKDLSSDYDFMAGIENPSKFALQLGLDFAQQIGSGREGGTIVVKHGPVIYSDVANPRVPDDELINGDIILFLKRDRYKGQQEYRFVLKAVGDTPQQDVLYLKVSDALRNLYSCIP